jgi:hypothetical protein
LLRLRDPRRIAFSLVFIHRRFYAFVGARQAVLRTSEDFIATLKQLIRRRAARRKGIRQHLGFSHENRAIPVLIAGHAEGELLVSTVTKLKKLADGDFLNSLGQIQR